MAAAGDELLCGIGSETTILGAQELREAVKLSLDKLGPKEKVLIIPPVRTTVWATAPAASFAMLSVCVSLLVQDFTRAHSQAGIITKLVYEYYGDKVKDILPALGSHVRPTHTDARYAACVPDVVGVVAAGRALHCTGSNVHLGHRQDVRRCAA